MATETQVTICNQFGVAKHVIEPAIQSVAWRLNNQSMAKFTMSMNDAKCTPDNLKFGNRIVVEWDNGLPDWGGVIDTPRRRGGGEVAFTAYSGERLLDFRITGKNTTITDDPGTIAQTLLENANASWDTTVSVGTIYAGGTSRTLDYHYHDLLQRLIDLARLTGEDFAVIPTFSSGKLTFALWWYVARGTDYSDSVWLIEDVNLDAKSFLDEQGPFHNRIVLAGEGTTWGTERIDSVSVDTTSRTAYGYREYSEVQSASVQTTLDANAAALLAEHKDPKNIPSLTVTDLAPALFTNYHLADTVTVEMCLDHALWHYKKDVRILFREWYPNDTCRLEVQESMSQGDLVHIPNNFIDRLMALERRMDDIERAAATGLFDGTLLDAPGAIKLTLTTEDVEVVDAGSAAATEQDWIELLMNDTDTGYVRVYAAK